MKMQLTRDWKQRLILAGVTALLSPAVLSAEPMPPSKPDVITVTAPRVVSEDRQIEIDIDLAALIDAIDERIADDQAKDLEAIGTRRIEVAILEVSTRG